jgi:The GLUG motif
MASAREYRHTMIVAYVLWCGLAAPGQEFAGGTGEPNDPYLIASAQNLIALGHAPQLYDKHFRLTADIDLSDHTFKRAVIAPDTKVSGWGSFQGMPFTGVLDGNDHVIRHLHIQGEDYLGLFGYLAGSAVVRDLGLENSSIQGMACVGGLAGRNTGTISHCYGTGVVTGNYTVGGLVGYNDEGHVSECHSTGEITGEWEDAGGLVGSNSGSLSNCYSTAEVNLTEGFHLGGLAGTNSGNVSNCYSTGAVTGCGAYTGGLIGYDSQGCVSNCHSTGAVTDWYRVGGLIGSSEGSSVSGCYSTSMVTGHDTAGGLIGVNGRDVSVSNCYSTGQVTGEENVGGLVGDNRGSVLSCFWDTEASGLATSPVGVGLTRSQMQEIDTYLDAGWDFVGESANGTAETWQMPQAGGYPRLSQFDGHEPVLPEGQGTLTEPFLITNAQELGSIGYRPLACYRLETDVDLAGIAWSVAPIPWFGGHFDGNGHVLRHLNVQGEGFLGLFGWLGDHSVVMDLGLEGASVQGTKDSIGALAGESHALLTNCYSTGTVAGHDGVGGLVGLNYGNASNSYHTGAVSGSAYVGGLVGVNEGGVSNCYSSGAITRGDTDVRGTPRAGGVVGYNYRSVVGCFWDMETSGLAASVHGGVGLTTAEMQDGQTYLDAGWDFAGERANGTAEIWQMPEAGGYPRLSVSEGYEPVLPEGQGTMTEPFLITNAQELGSVGPRPLACYRLETDIDLSGITWSVAVVRWFGGHFDGNGHVIRDLNIQGAGLLGLFGSLDADAVVTNLSLEDGSVQGADRSIGLLVGRSDGTLVNCHSTGAVSGGYWGTGGLVGYNCGGRVSNCSSAGAVTGAEWAVGGLVGYNWGPVATCCGTGEVAGHGHIGGLVGYNEGRVSNCSSAGAITGDGSVGGFAGYNWGMVSNCHSAGAVTGDGNRIGGLVGNNDYGRVLNCYSTGAVTGDNVVGGLVGDNDYGSISNCYSTGAASGNEDVGGLVGVNSGRVMKSVWDVESSGIAYSSSGTGLTTAEMMDPEWIGLQGWANNPNWVLDPHQDYPRLAWEDAPGQMIPEPIVDWMVGQGTSEMPYEIDDITQLLTITKAGLLRQKHIILMTDLDLAEIVWPQAALPDFSGTFDGNGHVIKNLKVSGNSYLGLVGRLDEGGTILNLGLLDVDIAGRGDNVGGLVGCNLRGHVLNCHSIGRIAGDRNIGGLVGDNHDGTVSASRSAAKVAGDSSVGGLVGQNSGNISDCYSTGEAVGDGLGAVGGLVGSSYGRIRNCYSLAQVSGGQWSDVGGLVGDNRYGTVDGSFWDIETSGQAESDAGTGLTTVEMQTPSTFLEAGWDFVGETDNGVEDLWWIDEGRDYPRLWWELSNVDPTDERQD